MNLLVLPVALPLLAAFLLPVLARVSESFARILGPLIMAACLGIAAGLADGEPFAVAVGGFRPPFGITFYADGLALLFTGLVALMTLALWPYRGEFRPREQSLTLILAASAAGLALSGDLFNIYVFYELVSVASFGLVAVRRTGAALAATMRYLILSGFGAALALVGIGVVYHLTGTLNLAQLAHLAPEMLNTPVGLMAFAAILIGVGVKAELFPVNTWVPEVYATAPKRVSALLAGLVSKLAVLVVVRLLVLVFHQPEALALLLTLGMLGVITGELAAWRARDMTRMLAFSSIGQLGIIFIAFALPGAAGLMAGLAMALHHLVVKPALFLLAERWGGALESLVGAARHSPLGAALFVLFGLSLVGVPPLPGFWAKLLVITGLAGQADSLYLTAMAVILVATVVEAGYLFRVVTMLYQRRGEGDTQAAVSGHANLDLGTAGAFGVALLAAVVLLVPLSEGLQEIATQAADTGRYISIVFPGGVTP